MQSAELFLEDLPKPSKVFSLLFMKNKMLLRCLLLRIVVSGLLDRRRNFPLLYVFVFTFDYFILT